MRPLILLAALLALAGCVDPLAAKEDPIDAATTDEVAPEPAPAEPASSPPPSDPPSSSSSSSSTSSSSSATSTSAPPPGPSPPPPPPIPWVLAGEAQVGYAAALGGPNASTQGQQDADHCAEVTFTLPAGATLLKFVVSPGDGTPPESGAGFLDVIIAPPEGDETRLGGREWPGPGDPPSGFEGDDALEVEAPAAGLWTLRAEAFGPAAMRVYTIAIEAEGESVVEPSDLLVTPACS